MTNAEFNAAHEDHLDRLGGCGEPDAEPETIDADVAESLLDPARLSSSLEANLLRIALVDHLAACRVCSSAVFALGLLVTLRWSGPQPDPLVAPSERERAAQGFCAKGRDVYGRLARALEGGV